MTDTTIKIPIKPTPMSQFGHINPTFRSFESNVDKIQVISNDFESNSGYNTCRPNSSKFKLIWRDLSFFIRITNGFLKRRTEDKTILKCMNGEISSGSMTALMGPSGAGKSTLLNCIANKLTTNVSGQIILEATIANQKNFMGDFRIGFVPQQDYLFKQFTVTETLMFASRLNNGYLSTENHREKVREVLFSLDLEQEADSKLSNLSGGQLKRASIGTELISKPRLLILDEPTSGLDSNNSEIVVTLLKKLTSVTGSETPAIIATIHQPSSDAFFLFDFIYLLSRMGTNLYHGPPQSIMSYLESFGFPHKTQVNPADYMIEVANGRYGTEAFDRMAKSARRGVKMIEHSFQKTIDNKDEDRKKMLDKETQTVQDKVYFRKHNMLQEFSISISNLKSKRATTFWTQCNLLFIRSLEADALKTPTTVARMCMGIMVGILLCGMSKDPIGEETGCWKTFANLSYVNENSSDEDATKKTFFDAMLDSSYEMNIMKQTDKIAAANVFFIMLLLYNCFISGMAGCMMFPLELQTVSKEISNSWYTGTAYFFAKVLGDYILMGFCVFPLILFVYVVSDQPWDLMRRPLLLFFFCYTTGILWEARAQLFSIICIKSNAIATILTVGIMFPNLFLSGFYLKIQDMRPFIKPITHISDARYGYEGMIITIYGWRCKGGELANYVVNDLVREKSLFQMLSKLFSTFNINPEDARKMAAALNVEESYLFKMLEAVADFFGPYDKNLDNMEGKNTSFMLSSLNIEEDHVVNCVIYMIVQCIIAKIIVFVALKVNTKVSRL